MFLAVLAAALALVFGAALIGCELDPADSTTRDVDVDFTGFYTGDGGPLVSQNSGKEVESLNLRQTGDELEAVDNNNLVFRGTLGKVTYNSGAASASFTLKGSTTAGNSVTANGTLSGEGTEGTMRGTWIESSLYGTIAGKAVINPVPTNEPGPSPTNGTTNVVTTLTISPNGATLSNDGDTQQFTASGGTSPYTWSVANTSGQGSLSPSTTANPVTYTRNSAGANTLSVKDANNNTASVSISQP